MSLIAKEFKRLSSMSTLDRNKLLCELSVKELRGNIQPFEIIQLEFIQTIRDINGEIDEVKSNRAKYES